ncbi:hypothetical protein [Romboutsia sp.]|uniref:hypothetical protein n=1 Tax=Romboutsia sp. TaxID=1965302 RepID=UPI002C2217DC|nr:hypothetical protein [Romboutsia sp.]HSQ90188.1 hypothetical protein [Romboutsia sp.]
MSNSRSKKITMKDVATYFYDNSGIKYDSHIFKVTIAQIKTLTKRGYTLERIKEVMEYIFKHLPPKGIYSFGYVLTVIEDIDKILSDIENQPIATIPTDIKIIGNKKKINNVKVNYDESLFK